MLEKSLNVFNHYGYKNQLKKLCEEMYEFIEAELEYKAGIGSKEHVIEELSDVWFLLTQFMVGENIQEGLVYGSMLFKADRQLQRIEDE